MTSVFIAAATALALSASPGPSVVAKHHALPVLTPAAEGGSINNNYGTPQPQPLYAAFVQPTGSSPTYASSALANAPGSSPSYSGGGIG